MWHILVKIVYASSSFTPQPSIQVIKSLCLFGKAINKIKADQTESSSLRMSYDFWAELWMLNLHSL